MSIKIETPNRSELDLLQHLLPDEPTEDQVREIAEQLVQTMAKEPAVLRQAEVIVRRMVNQRREAKVRQAALDAGQHWVFARRAATFTATHPTFEQVKVYRKDFDAFCERYQLSVREMVKVGAGLIESHNGWKQGASAGSLGQLRTKLLAKDQVPANGITGPFRAAFRTPEEGINGAPAPVYLPVHTWTPSE